MMVSYKSGQQCSVFRRNGYALTYLSFLGQILISQVLIIQYSLIRAAVTTPPSNEFSTEYIELSTEEPITADMQFVLNPDMNSEEPEIKMELLRALISENNDSEIFKDLEGAADEDFHIEDHGCQLGACAFRVIHSKRSFIIKQHIILDDKSDDTQEDPSITVETAQLEYKVLQQRSGELPGLVPKPYLLSLNHSAIVIEDFSDYISLKDLLVSGAISDDALHNVPLAVAALHLKTYNQVDTAYYNDFKTNKVTETIVKAKYTQLFSNATVEKLKEGGINYTEVDELGSQKTVDRVAQLYAYITNNKETTLHGLLIGSHVLLNAGKVKLVGNQFAWVGPCALDVGTLLTQFLANYQFQMLTERDKDAHREVANRMINASISFIETYMAEMNITDKEKSKEFVSMVAGIAGVELVCWSFTEYNPNTINTTVAIYESGMRLLQASDRIDNPFTLVNIALMPTQ